MKQILIVNNLIIYKNILFSELKYNFNFNQSIYNKSYNQNSYRYYNNYLC